MMTLEREQNSGRETTSPPAGKPLILAPAGNRSAFFAALAAGADAVYCGLKQFSARMAAENFTPGELARLVTVAHDRGAAVHLALNTLVKPNELDPARSLTVEVVERIRPDAVIIQDLGFVTLLRQAGFTGQIHLSTLAAVTCAAELKIAAGLPGISQVVLPRELTIDEIKQMAAACPRRLRLEIFIHGALCYGVSGRCYWSSYLGGKSGLRGRCVQPCRRLYTQDEKSGRFFSCLDLSLDVLVKTLLTVPEIATWKIEGRKKGPHYVYYTVTAYKLLRDQGTDPAVKKTALQYLEQALGRRPTHYYFLPQRPYLPAGHGEETASGRFVGAVAGGGRDTWLAPRFPLLKGDLLRIGYEDRPGHSLHRVSRSVPRQGRLHLKSPSTRAPAKGTPVFLIDRMEGALVEQIKALEAAFQALPEPPFRPTRKALALPVPIRRRPAARDMDVYRLPPGGGRGRAQTGLWLSPKSLEQATARGCLPEIWIWLPPVIWQADADGMQTLINKAREKGARRFVVNAPWQLAFFDGPATPEIWAGPFCNLTNALSLGVVKDLGCTGAVVSPELGGADFFSLAGQSPLPLGLVVAGAWPLCLARTRPGQIEIDRPFFSPRQEASWITPREDGCFWVYPNWTLDLGARREELRAKGYSLFIRLVDPLPTAVSRKDRPGSWNWETGLD